MQYLRARYYNPASGTFNRLDPFAGNMQDPQSLHKYLYVHGDPIQGTDPTGKFFISLALGSLLSSKLNLTHSQKVVAIGATAVAGFFETIGWVTLGQYLYNRWITPVGRNVPLTYFGQRRAFTGRFPSRQSVVARLGEPAAGVNERPDGWPQPTQVLGSSNARVSRAALSANQLFGPAGCGPCVGVLFVTPTELVAAHFTPGVDSPRGTLARLGPFPAGTRAVLNGATVPKEWQYSEFTIDEVLRWINADPNITLDGFHDSPNVFANANGEYYDF